MRVIGIFLPWVQVPKAITMMAFGTSSPINWAVGSLGPVIHRVEVMRDWSMETKLGSHGDCMGSSIGIQIALVRSILDGGFGLSMS